MKRSGAAPAPRPNAVLSASPCGPGRRARLFSRGAQLMQDGEREFHFGLNTRRPHHAALRRALLHVVQQDSLADSRLTAQDQHPALTGPHLSQQPVKRRLLGPPAAQSRPTVTAGHRPPPRP